MREILFALLISSLCANSFAQQKDFEGIVYYSVEVKSKSDMSDKNMMNLLAADDKLTIYIRQGNYRRVNSKVDEYYITKDEKAYLKFKKIDTLYYVNYSSDTIAVTNISKTEEQKNIVGFGCRSISISSSKTTSKYFYAPSLHMDPVYDKNNTIGNFNIYARETESIWLSHYNETENFVLNQTCTRVEQKPLDETVFDLPKLPQKEFSLETVTKPAEFRRGGEAGWIKYLQANVNTSVSSKYLKIPKGEKEATQTVQLSFVISETGEIINIKVLNKQEVHSKLADEAVRLVKEGYGWKPGTRYGENISSLMKQKITFQVSKE